MKTIYKIIGAILLVGLVVFGLMKFDQSKVVIEPNETAQIILINDEEWVERTYPDLEIEWILQSGWVTSSLLEKYNIYADYDLEDGIVTLADGNMLLRYDMDYDKAQLNGQPFEMEKPQLINTELWIPLKQLQTHLNLKYDGDIDQKSMFVKKLDVNYTLAELKEDTYLLDTISGERLLKKMSQGETVMVYPYDEAYDYVMSEDYQVGFVAKALVGEQRVVNNKMDVEAAKEKIYLTWEVYGRGYDTNKIGEMKGVNVISPAWYALSDAQGNFSSKPSENYMNWAKGRDYKVWALVSNDFKVDRTNQFLHSAVARHYFIDNLLEEYIRMGYDGVNIDFENVYKEDKRQLTQFVAELSSEFKRAGLTVSMDVTVMGGSDTWSKCYDRKAIGHMIDYLAIMTYDEHWASSPVSGSVASYNWVKESMIRIAEDVPSEKLLLGIPYYMRVWTEVPSTEVANKMKVKSGVLNMPNAEKFIKEKNLNLIWDENARQHYAGYFENGALKKIWFENATSIKEKASLINELELGGAAVWRRGFETQDIWSIIDEEMNGK